MPNRDDPRDSSQKVTRCPAKNQAGDPCSATVLPGATYCRWHDPALAEERKEWSRRGGKAKSNTARARKALHAGALTAEELRGQLGAVFTGVVDGSIEPAVGTAAATIARALLDVARVAEVEQQVAQIRRDIARFTESGVVR